MEREGAGEGGGGGGLMKSVVERLLHAYDTYKLYIWSLKVESFHFPSCFGRQ